MCVFDGRSKRSLNTSPHPTPTPQVSSLFVDVPKAILYQMASTIQTQMFEPGDVVVLQGDIGHE